MDNGASPSCVEWRGVPGFERHYMVGDNGQIRNRSTGKLLYGEIDRDGYRRVNLSREGKTYKRRVHRLVCEAFHGPAGAGLETRHGDGQRLNNAASNLSWGTKSDNMRDAVVHGTINRDTRAASAASAMVDRRGSRNPGAKLSDEQGRQMRLMAAEGYSERVIARTFSCSPATAHRVVSGERHVG